jgi:YVTN family beta-propeller protein
VSYSQGVDLGTTFVAAAIAHGARTEMFTLGDRAVVMPAMVYATTDGSLVTGEAAGRRAVTNPDRVGREFKRRLGDPTPVVLGGTPYPVTSLLAALLRDVMARVTENEGTPPDNVVLTHPANWGPFRRELFDEVPQLAGVSQVRMVTEPEAAAAHYAAARQRPDGDTVAVYDLGGGTFDATVLRKRAGGFDILGTPEGIERLGGVDFDEAILSYVNYSSGGALSELDMGNPQTPIALARLRQDCVLAKEALSVDSETTIPVFLPNRHFDVRLARTEFEGMIRAQIESTIGALTRTLHSAHVDPDELSAVLLVGGSSRIPLVGWMISEALDRPTLVDTHPKYAVALGAATLAAAHTPDAAAGNGARPPRLAPAPREGEPALGALAGTAAASLVEPAAAVAAAPGGSALDAPVRPAPAPPATEGHTHRHRGQADARLSDRQPTQRAAVSIPRQRERPGTGSSDSAEAGGGGYGRGGPPPPPPLGAEPDRRRRWLVVAGAAAAVLLALVVSIVYVSRSAPPEAPIAAPPAPDVVIPAPAPLPDAAPLEIGASLPIPAVGGEIPVGQTPGFVAIAPNGKFAYVANRGAGFVTVVDTAINKVVAQIPIPDGPPQYLAFAPDGRRLYVSVFKDPDRSINEVAVLDTLSNRVITTIPVGTRPYALAVKPDGSEIYVPNHDSGTVSVIDTRTDSLVTDIQVKPNPHWLEFSKDGRYAYTANHDSNLVSVIDTASRTVTAEIRVQLSPHSVAVHPTEPLLANVNYDSNSVTVIDTRTAQVIATVPVGTHPQDVTWAPDGRHMYVTNVDSDDMTVISVDGYRVTATQATGNAPTSIAVLPDGRRAYVSNLNTGTLTVLDTAG